MLDRATRCLETGSRPMLQSTSRPLRTTRCLHQDFWSQTSPASALLTHTLFDSHAKSASKAVRRNGHPPNHIFLDFLYPPEAKAYLVRAVKRSTTDSRHLRISKTNVYTDDKRKRSFSSTSRQHQRRNSFASVALAERIEEEDDEAIGHDGHLQHDEESAPDFEGSEEVASLSQQIERYTEAPSEQHCRTMLSKLRSIPSPVLTENPDVVESLLHALNAVEASSNPSQVIEIYKGLPLELRARPSIRILAIRAYVRLDEMAQATNVLSNLYEDSGDIGENFEAMEVILRIHVEQEQWIDAMAAWLRLWTKYHGPIDIQNASLRTEFNNRSREMFKRLSSIRDLAPRIETLLRQFRSTDFWHRKATRFFFKGLITSMFRSGSDFGPSSTAKTLKELADMGLVHDIWYEDACVIALRHNVPVHEQLENAMVIYKRYRQDMQFVPSKHLIGKLLVRAITDKSVDDGNALFDDLIRFYPKGLTPKLRALVMGFFAYQGRAAQVQNLFDSRPNQSEAPHDRYLKSLLHVYAVLANPDAVWSRMQSFEESYGVIPDTVCWNILLNAYVRSHDYEGALQTYKEMSNRAVKPNATTFGTLMAISAYRADHEAVERFQAAAVGEGLAEPGFQEELVVLSYLNAGNITEARKRVEAWNMQVQALPLKTRVWNQLLTGLALRADVNGTLKTVQEMRKAEVPFDNLTYAALMRLFVICRHMTYARYLFNQMIKTAQLKPLAFHYALLIDGYAQIGQYETAYRYHAEMLGRNMKPTLSSRVALLKLQILSRQRLRSKAGVKQERLESAEELVEELLNETDPSIIAGDEPQALPSLTSLSISSHEAVYFDAILKAMRFTRSPLRIEALIKRFANHLRGTHEDTSQNAREPLNILLALMFLRFRQQRPDEIGELWKASVAISSELVGNLPRSTASVRSRVLLGRHLDVYMQALDDAGRIDEMAGVFEELFSRGYDPDHLNWNWCVLIFASRGHLEEALDTCERHLLKDPSNMPKQFTTQRGKASLAGSSRSPPKYLLGSQISQRTMAWLGEKYNQLREQSHIDGEANKTFARLNKRHPRMCRALLQLANDANPTTEP